MFYGSNTNICTVIGCSKLGVKVLEKGCGRFHFWRSCRPTVFSIAGEWAPLRLFFKNFVSVSVLKYTSRRLLLKIFVIVKFCNWTLLVWPLNCRVWAGIQQVFREALFLNCFLIIIKEGAFPVSNSVENLICVRTKSHGCFLKSQDDQGFANYSRVFGSHASALLFTLSVKNPSVKSDEFLPWWRIFFTDKILCQRNFYRRIFFTDKFFLPTNNL